MYNVERRESAAAAPLRPLVDHMECPFCNGMGCGYCGNNGVLFELQNHRCPECLESVHQFGKLCSNCYRRFVAGEME